MTCASHLRIASMAALGLALASPLPASAADLYGNGAFAALASDQPAGRVGDTLTVIIDETSTASNSTQSASAKTSHFGGLLAVGTTHGGTLDMTGAFNGAGQTQRTHKIIGEITVIVDRVLENGDLEVSGAEALKINGERTNIRVKGLVRPADIDADNTVLSTRLAGATIDYDGSGFLDKAAKPGLLNRLVNWIGLP